MAKAICHGIKADSYSPLEVPHLEGIRVNSAPVGREDACSFPGCSLLRASIEPPDYWVTEDNGKVAALCEVAIFKHKNNSSHV